jgi:hypothetical protein
VIKAVMGLTNNDWNKRQPERQWNWLSKDKLRSSRTEEWLQSCVPICKTENILEQKTGGREDYSSKISIS